MYIALCVDDLFLVGRRLERIKEVKGGLHAEFKMKDLAEAKLLLVQERYAQDVNETFNIKGCKSVLTLLGARRPAGHFLATSHR